MSPQRHPCVRTYRAVHHLSSSICSTSCGPGLTQRKHHLFSQVRDLRVTPDSFCVSLPGVSPTVSCIKSIPQYFSKSFYFLTFTATTWTGVIIWNMSAFPTALFDSPNFYLFILFMKFSRQEYWSSLHSLHQLTTFCQNSQPWPTHLGWPYTAWLIVSLS